MMLNKTIGWGALSALLLGGLGCEVGRTGTGLFDDGSAGPAGGGDGGSLAGGGDVAAGPTRDGGDGGLEACGPSCIRVPADATVVQRAGLGPCEQGWQGSRQLYVAEQPGCPTCECGSPEGGSCALRWVDRYLDGVCFDLSSGGFDVGAICRNVSALPANQARGYSVGPSVVFEAGQCGVLDVAVQPAATTSLCVLTEPLSSSCEQDDVVCLPTTEDRQDACLFYAGQVSCPAGYRASALFDGMVDSRSCRCACGDEEGASCSGGGLFLHDRRNCATEPDAFVPAGTECADVTGYSDHDSFETDPGTFTAGACPASPSHQGQVSLSAQQTLCCPVAGAR